MEVGTSSKEFGHTSVRKALALNGSTSSISSTEVFNFVARNHPYVVKTFFFIDCKVYITRPQHLTC